MEYSFFYDETEHSRKINIQTVTADNYYDNFSTAIIGWKKENEDIIIKQYEAFEEKYTYRKKNGELKSQTMKQKDLKYGFATLNNHTIGFYEDLLLTFNQNTVTYISIFSKVEYLIQQVFRDYHNSFFVDIDCMKYSIIKAKRGKADDYDKYCLRIEANADMVVEKLDELYRARKIPAAITMKQEFKDLHGSVKLLNEYRDKKRELKGTSKDIINVLCKNAEDAIRKQQEGAFRKVIESELKQFRTPKEKLKNIANNPEYHWIGELYPAVYTRAKRIFFMSMDKFFLGNTTIIEPTYSFYNNDITKNAIIFIDEFDATRDRLLNQIITRGLENHIDYLGLFHRVYASLKTRDFPAELTTASKLVFHKRCQRMRCI